jgi:hypothetical protein
MFHQSKLNKGPTAKFATYNRNIKVLQKNLQIFNFGEGTKKGYA